MKMKVPDMHQNTFLKKLVIPIMIVLTIQVVVFMLVLLLGSLLPQIQNNAFDTLESRVELRAQYIENEMIHRWTNLGEEKEKILSIIDSVLSEQGASYEDIAVNPDLNGRIVSAASEEILYMLRKNTVTEAYIILNGPGTPTDVEHGGLAGFYVRDMDPISYSSDNEDILVERGRSHIVKKMKLAMDSQWETSFNPGDPVVEDVLLRPMHAAMEQPGLDYIQYGCWSPSFNLSEGDGMPVFTYGIPLITEDGQVLGIIGIGLTEHYMQSLLNYDELQDDKTGAYFLGYTTDGGATYEKVFTNGPLYQVQFGAAKSLSGESTSYGLLHFNGQNGKNEYYGSCQTLKLYDVGTPFYKEQWVLMGIVGKEELFSLKNELLSSVFFTSALAVILGCFGVYLASRIVTKPLRSLAVNVANADTNQRITLNKVHIEEIDQLIEAVEKMSNAVADEASKFSRIIKLAKVKIGAFEYSDSKDMVYCSQTMSEMFGWHAKGESLPILEFSSKLEELEIYRVKRPDIIYCIPGKDGELRWIQMKIQLDTHVCLGVVIDITADMLEKQKIEYERDYDLLTNIYNRRAFMDRITALFQTPQKLGIAGLMMFDMDSLKYVNDTYGHENGDAYIKELADKLRLVEEQGGLICRRSGDEFFAFLYGYGSREEMNEVVKALWSHIKTAYIMVDKDMKFPLLVSAGLAVFPDDSREIEELMRFADYAMYEAKNSSKGVLKAFDRNSYDRRADGADTVIQ